MTPKQEKIDQFREDSGEYMSLDEDGKSICLDGNFTLDELKKIIAIIEE